MEPHGRLVGILDWTVHWLRDGTASSPIDRKSPPHDRACIICVAANLLSALHCGASSCAVRWRSWINFVERLLRRNDRKEDVVLPSAAEVQRGFSAEDLRRAIDRVVVQERTASG